MPTPAASLRATLEAALVANPDDAAAYAAYADHLLEQNDPRGELVQVQLALEDPARPADERRRLQAREKALLDQHAAGWTGDVGRFLVGDWSGEDRPFHYRFARGWLDFVRVLPFPEAMFPALARSPEARLLRTLEIVYDMRYHPWESNELLEGPNGALRDGESPSLIYEEVDLLPPLIASPYLTNLRSFTLGFGGFDRPVHTTMVGVFNGCTAQQVVDLLGKCPRLEELYLNTSVPDVEGLFASPALANLRVLQYYFGFAEYDSPGDAYPLSVLAENPAARKLTTLRLLPSKDGTVLVDELDALVHSPNLPKLEHLQVRMTTFGDEGCRRVVDSGILRRLKTLDLGSGTMTDAGARVLAGSPDLKRLTVLDVSLNALTPAGINALKATGVHVVADEQHDGGTDFLYSVDVE